MCSTILGRLRKITEGSVGSWKLYPCNAQDQKETLVVTNGTVRLVRIETSPTAATPKRLLNGLATTLLNGEGAELLKMNLRPQT